MKPTLPERRRLIAAAALLIAGCGTSPPVSLYRLPLDAPPGTAGARPAALQTWELAAVVGIPEYLDRDAIVVGSGGTAVQVLAGQRWAEPLRDSVPRLLYHDLAQIRGAAVTWLAPSPAGVKVDRVLKVEVLALNARSDRAQVELRARWLLVDPSGATLPQTGNVELAVDAAGPAAEQIVAAHRVALWRLAERVAGA